MNATETEHVDVLIVGAGLSGIGAAYRVRTELPNKRLAILESRDEIGGTWDLFRYPGVRSDSDMQTLGYRFRPWTQPKSIADGASILDYVRDTAAEAGIDKLVRFGHRVVRASWSTADAHWTVSATHDGVELTITCNFLYMCSGYYDYDEGYAPVFPGIEQFEGRVVHPQHWPADLDHTGKRVVVIGSGATAVTLVPALAPDAVHVTMLQRSPTYIISVPGEDPIANKLRRILGDRLGYPAARWKNIAVMTMTYQLSRRRPDLVKSFIRKMQVAQLPAGYDVGTHFAPTYQPWDQRLCVVPDGDLFRVIRKGEADIVTDRIVTFTPNGLTLGSGQHLPADIVVSATGLNLLLFGGITFDIDGVPVSMPDTLAYKGMMLSGVPNFAFSIGYTNASWTLKADLVAEYVCRLLKYADAHGHRQFMPVDDDPTIERRPLLDFAAGYVLRSIDKLPKNGSKSPWQLGMNYAQDLITLRFGRIRDRAMRFTSPVGTKPAPDRVHADA